MRSLLALSIILAGTRLALGQNPAPDPNHPGVQAPGPNNPGVPYVVQPATTQPSVNNVPLPNQTPASIVNPPRYPANQVRNPRVVTPGIAPNAQNPAVPPPVILQPTGVPR